MIENHHIVKIITLINQTMVRYLVVDLILRTFVLVMRTIIVSLEQEIISLSLPRRKETHVEVPLPYLIDPLKIVILMLIT